MSAGNSITFRMGFDLNGLRSDASEAQKIVVKSTADTKAQMDAAMKSTAAMTGEAGGGKGSGKAGGHGGPSSLATREIGDGLDAITGQKGWVMRMRMLQAGLPIAALAGLAIGFVKVTEAIMETKKATKEASDELSHVHANTEAAAGPEAASKAYEKLGESIEKVKASRTVLARIGDMAIGGSQMEKSLEMQRRLETARLDVAQQLGIHMAKETEERQKAWTISEREFALVKARQAAEEKTAHIRESSPGGMITPQIRAVAAELAMQEEEINRKADAQQAEAQLEANIVQAKMNGRDVSIQEAVDRLSYAQKIFEASNNDEEAEIARQKVVAAREGVVQAERETAERKRGLASEIELAAIVGDADAKHMAALMAEGQAIAQKIADPRTHADDREKLIADQAKNQGAQRDAGVAAGLKAFDIGNDIIDADKGAGAGEEQLALLKKIELEKSRLAFMDANGSGPEALQKQNAKLAEMGRQYDEIVRRQADSTDSASNENDVLQEKLVRHEAIGEALRTQFEFQQKIKQAHRDGNEDLAAQLNTQRQLTLELQTQNLKRQVGDRSKATISELAANAHNAAGKQAREIERIEKRAEAQRKQGHMKEASDLQDRADKLRKAGAADPRNPEAQKLQEQSDKLRRQGHITDANRLRDQADKIRQGTSPLKDSEQQTGLLKEQLTELQQINAGVQGVRNAR
jgi:hypothetical protein